MGSDTYINLEFWASFGGLRYGEYGQRLCKRGLQSGVHSITMMVTEFHPSINDMA